MEQGEHVGVCQHTWSLLRGDGPLHRHDDVSCTTEDPWPRCTSTPWTAESCCNNRRPFAICVYSALLCAVSV